MTWIEKVNKLKGVLTLSKLGGLAGWPQNSLSTSMKRGSMPNAGLGIRLANALGVPAEWLFDDNLGMDQIEAIAQPTAGAELWKYAAVGMTKALQDAKTNTEINRVRLLLATMLSFIDEEAATENTANGEEKRVFREGLSNLGISQNIAKRLVEETESSKLRWALFLLGSLPKEHEPRIQPVDSPPTEPATATPPPPKTPPGATDRQVESPPTTTEASKKLRRAGTRTVAKRPSKKPKRRLG